MKLSLAFPVLLLFLSLTAAWPAPDQKEPTVTKEVALKAITLFREQPHTEAGRGAAALILRFAEESPDVKVTLEHSQMEWFGPKEDLKNYSILLVAYVAGSLRSQLDSGKKEHDGPASAKQVVETYKKLKQIDPKLGIEPIEKMLAESEHKSK